MLPIEHGVNRLSTARSGTVGAMRWERLFTELEAEAAELAGQDREAEIADRIRAEVARTTWVDRIRAGIGTSVRLRLLGADLVEGTVLQVGTDWLLLRAGANDVLVPVHAVVGLEGTAAGTRVVATVPGEVVAPTWTAAWRVLARDRASVRVVRAGGAPCTASRCVWEPTSSSSTRRSVRSSGILRAAAGCWCRMRRSPRPTPARIPPPGDRSRRRQIFVSVPRSGHSSARSSASSPNGCASMNSRVSEYRRWMYASSSEASTRQAPRPPILIAVSSPRRTSA